MMKDSRYSLWFCVGMAFVIFTVLVLLNSLEDVFGLSDDPEYMFIDLWRHFIGWNSWVPTVPVAYWLVNKHLDGKSKTWQIILLIILGTMLVIIYKALLFEYYFYQFFPKHKETLPIWETILRAMIHRRSILETIIFWFILAAIFALQYSRLLQVREKQEHLLKSELTQAHLHALKQQLQPHFLFNTLNSISSLLREKVKPEQLQSNMQTADDMLTNLSEMFRHTLTTADVHLIPLRDELTFLENYLAIENVRFAEKLRIEMNIDPALHSIEVPAFLLQPIVENSIRHGTSKHSKPGLVRIEIHQQDETLDIRITDNGSCTADELKHAFNAGVGLRNTQKRLHHLYGDQYSLSIQKNETDETEVTIVFPIKSPMITTTGGSL